MKIWFPTIRAGSGSDVFTERLVTALNQRGVRAEITWLPHRAEYVPWTVAVPKPPVWANVVHINSWLHTRFIPTALPLVVTVHGCVHDPALEPYKSLPQAFYHRWWVRRLEAATLHRADLVTAVSQYTTRQTMSVFGRNDIVAIPNWIDTDQLCPSIRQQSHSPFRLLFIGNFTRRKGADLLPKIMEKLGSDFELRFTGISPVKLKFPANMISLGWTTDSTVVKHWMCEADALLFPSRMEGLPLAVLEALACGLPVIASNSASLPELIEHGGNGLLCPVDDISAFVAAARQMSDHPDQWQAMQAMAYRSAQAYHSEAPVVEAYLRLYHKLVANISNK